MDASRNVDGWLSIQMADRLGIMIWQDFLFACSMYPISSWFLDTVSVEVTQNVRRLQYHPSIILWAGNHENEAALRGNWYTVHL
jgi:beta-mannosidase